MTDRGGDELTDAWNGTWEAGATSTTADVKLALDLNGLFESVKSAPTGGQPMPTSVAVAGYCGVYVVEAAAFLNRHLEKQLEEQLEAAIRAA
jgi:hypothetical protein